MSEIKFRAKTKIDGNCKVERWVYGYYIKHITVTPAALWNSRKDFENFIEEHTQHKIAYDGFSDWNMPRGLEVVDVIPETLSQFTGLHDKNGVEIWEGDTCQFNREVGIIEWSNSDGMWCLNTKVMSYNFGDLNPAWIKVIGNIHDKEMEE